MLSEAVLATRREASRQLTESLGQARLGSFECEALERVGPGYKQKNSYKLVWLPGPAFIGTELGRVYRVKRAAFENKSHNETSFGCTPE